MTGLAGRKIYKPSDEGWERVASIIQSSREGPRVKARAGYDRTKHLVEQHTKKTNACAKK